jgi:hypothetical protein
MTGIARYAALLLFVATPAQADWLDRAWDGQAVDENREPSITLGETGVLVVLPQTTLDDAHAAGLSTPDAVRQILERYGQHCSAVIDLDRPHPHLRVELYLEKNIALATAPSDTRSEVQGALKSQAPKAPPDTLSVTAENYSELFIDYVPRRIAHCTEPGGAES